MLTPFFPRGKTVTLIAPPSIWFFHSLFSQNWFPLKMTNKKREPSAIIYAASQCTRKSEPAHSLTTIWNCDDSSRGRSSVGFPHYLPIWSSKGWVENLFKIIFTHLPVPRAWRVDIFGCSVGERPGVRGSIGKASLTQDSLRSYSVAQYICNEIIQSD